MAERRRSTPVGSATTPSRCGLPAHQLAAHGLLLGARLGVGRPAEAELGAHRVHGAAVDGPPSTSSTTGSAAADGEAVAPLPAPPQAASTAAPSAHGERQRDDEAQECEIGSCSLE